MATLCISFIIYWTCIFCLGTARKLCGFYLEINTTNEKYWKADYICESHNLYVNEMIKKLKCLNQAHLTGLNFFSTKGCNDSNLPLIQFKQLYLDYNQCSTKKRLVLRLNKLTWNKSELFVKDVDLNNGQCENVSLTVNYLNLEKIDLTVVPHFLFPSNITGSRLPVLTNLNLGYNQLKELPSDLLHSREWHSLREFYAGHNKISYISPYFFHSISLKNIAVIDLSFNLLETLPSELLNSSNLANLSFIAFNNNKIKKLPHNLFQHKFLTKLQKIDLGHNCVEFIPFGFFKDLECLITINLNNNNIKSITKDMLPKKLYCLCFLNIAHNKISSIGLLVPKITGKIGKYGVVTKPCTLNASHNSLTVQETKFIFLKSQSFGIASSLDVSCNNISKFEGFTKQEIPRSPSLRLVVKTSGNQLFSVINLVKSAMNIDIHYIEKLKPISLHPSSIFRLQAFIKAFPYEYKCNCAVEKYLKLQNLHVFKEAAKEFNVYTNLEKDFNHIKCGSPKNLKGKYIDELIDFKCGNYRTLFQCENYKCTENKKCICTETPENNTVRINCNKINIEKLPGIKVISSFKLEIYARFNKIYEMPMLQTDIAVHVIRLDLSHNLLKSIPNSFFSQYPNLTDLNLAANLFVTLPSGTKWKNMNSLAHVQFSGNNFVCNCTGLQLKETIKTLHAKITDLDSIKCSAPLHVKNEVVYNMPDSLFGCSFGNLVLILTLTLSLLLFLFVVFFVAYVFRYYIHLFLFVHFGWRFCYSYTEEKTLYDVFISYSAKDSDWVVDQLVNPLENLDPPYNVCLHERDFVIGFPICENISKAVNGSKCTICVVSRNWLESDWCQFEFRVAHSMATVEKKVRLLVILKEEIPKNKISGDLKFYMRTFTYLDAAQPLFWSRLLNDLPKPDEVGDDRDVIELI